jgi:hypothetical protein
MAHWRIILRKLAAEARLHLLARSLSRPSRSGFNPIALTCAVAVIAMLAFGTLSARPFYGESSFRPCGQTHAMIPGCVRNP